MHRHPWHTGTWSITYSRGLALRKARWPIGRPPISRGIVTGPSRAALQTSADRFCTDVDFLLSGIKKGELFIPDLAGVGSHASFVSNITAQEMFVVNNLTWHDGVLPAQIPSDIILTPIVSPPTNTPTRRHSMSSLWKQITSQLLLVFPDSHIRTPSNLKELLSDPRSPFLPVVVHPPIPFSVSLSVKEVDTLSKLLKDALRRDKQAQALVVLVRLWAETGKLRDTPTFWIPLMVLWFLRNPATKRYSYDWIPPIKGSSWQPGMNFGGSKVDENWPSSIMQYFAGFLRFYKDLQQKALIPPIAGENFTDDQLFPYFQRLSASLSEGHWIAFIAQAGQTLKALEINSPSGVFFATSLEAKRKGFDHDDFTLQQFYDTTRSSARAHLQRIRTIRRIENVLRDKFGPEYSLEQFGSTSYGVDTDTSDLDLVVVDPHSPIGVSEQTRVLPAIYSVNAAAQALRRAGFADVVPINAAVPIVKFKDPTTGLTGDINVNNRLGLSNSALINRYCALSPVLRPALTAIKAWANSLHLNDPGAKKGTPTFSSYTLALMTIAVLQTKGYLPNLHGNIRGRPKDREGEVFWVTHKRSIRIKCDLRFEQMKEWTPERQLSSVAETLRMWFKFWTEEFNYDRCLVDIREGGIVLRRTTPSTNFRSQFCYVANGKHNAEVKYGTEKAQRSKTSFVSGVINNTLDLTWDNWMEPPNWEDEPFIVVDPFVSIVVGVHARLPCRT
ncbi:hypothetical protein BXZ70DRAFT_925042 [Cristinia sonorae]|uniref:Poly(A) RNA polymerase mitochondrial-like central palm domain-containing protein n=1 Tax=Cristinia sonorae TaxID=1940300 RepID=A0A8K0XS71_9AGAR|nr:hypothetical protein BXZ70DRAFT_925042 [Cristinia sonorae]